MIYNTWDFALFSANIHHFFSDISWHSHTLIYKKWVEYHKPKFIKPETPWDLDNLIPIISNQPSIICLYHLGYHAQIPSVIANQNICFDILIDRNAYEDQHMEINKMKSNLLYKDSSYQFLFSDDPQVLVKARSTLAQGRHLLIFADGNSGTLKDATNNRVEVDFCGNKIKVRKGIAVLSYLLKVPIIPLTHSNSLNRFKILPGRILLPLNYNKGKEYILFAMQYLYSFLEQQIIDEPFKWESWNYLHEMACFDIGIHDTQIQDNLTIRDSWLLMELNGNTGYFDRSSYNFIYLNLK